MAKKKDVFKTWREEQDVYSKMKIASMKKLVGKKNINKLRRTFLEKLADIRSLASLFEPSLQDFLHTYSVPGSKIFEEQFSKMYDLLDGNIEDFISHLQSNDFATKKQNSAEKKLGINALVKKHCDMFDILFDQEDDEKKNEFLFTVANKFFEFCFDSKTFPKFKKLISNSDFHPIVRLLYSVMWTNLAEIGWQHWHADAIKVLKKRADTGKQIVYIAGGTDIYQLIKHGIYNIRVIDPLLPSQPKYYSQGWEWFIKGKGKGNGVGEEMILPVGREKLILRRAAFKKTGKSFTMQLSTNKTATIDESVTTWHLCRGKNVLGKIFFDRRLTNQDDFNPTSKQSLLVSFNELYFISAPKKQDGWGINPHKFSDNIEIIIKQLEKSVGKKVSCNMRYEIKQGDFAFISLGSCVD